MNGEGLFDEIPKARRYARAIEHRLSSATRDHSFPKVFNEASKGLLDAGGKLLRPILTLCAAEITGKRYNASSLDAAVALELVHVSSLILDDIIDEAPLRRGRATLHAKYGNDVAIVSAGLLLLRGLKRVGENKRIRAVGYNALGELLLGQGLETRGRIQTMARYLEMIDLKTASLFSAAMEMGAVANRLGPRWVKELREYGRNLGLAFQIQDDILDFVGHETATRKRVNGRTAALRPTAVAMHLNDGEEVSHRSRKDWSALRKRARESGAVERSRALARSYSAKAIAMSEVWPNTAAKHCLIGLTQAMMGRDS